jgi:SagB-type dehydrogenase family enzyme/YcaO-like protein with predicted kinase domain
MVPQPLQVSPAVAVEDGIQFRVGTEAITVSGHEAIVWAILRYTNGLRSWVEVIDKAAEQVDAPASQVSAAAEDLVSLGVLEDSRALHDLMLGVTENPMTFASDMRPNEYAAYESELGWVPEGDRLRLPALVGAHPSRRSCRAFGDAPLTPDDLGQLLSHACNQAPSAGALRPIRLSAVVNRAVGDIPPGLYHYVAANHSLVAGRPTSDEERRFMLNREDGVHNAPVVLVVAADLQRQTRKYANRGLRYSLIEAGIAVERLLTAASELSLESLVFGGYDDVALSEGLFGYDTPRIRSLITIAVGHRGDRPLPDLDLEDLHTRVDDLFVGDGRIVEGAGATARWRVPGDLSFHQVLATLRGPDDRDVVDRICGGTGASLVAARTKAIVECVERHSSGIIRVDAVGPARTVNPRFSLSGFAPLTSEQIANSPYLVPFDPDTQLEWVVARDAARNEETFVPVDLVYYPLSVDVLGRRLLFAANSSGVASHTQVDEAERRALFELIERHAVLTAWHRQDAPSRVAPLDLPKYARSREEYWATQGYELLVLDFSDLGVPVAGVAIGSSTSTPVMTFGSAAAGSFDEAVVKALHEAELALAGYRSTPEGPMAADEVVTPLHHGRFHAYDDQRRAWDFLRDGGTGSPDASTPVRVDYSAVVDLVHPLFVQIDSPAPIVTVRALSDRLLPISFGSALEHRPSWSLAPNLPHFIA